jgi:hypothetical protein
MEGSGVGVDWYAKLKDRPYIYADHIWPHDGGHGNIRDVNGNTLEATARLDEPHSRLHAIFGAWP